MNDGPALDASRHFPKCRRGIPKALPAIFLIIVEILNPGLSVQIPNER